MSGIMCAAGIMGGGAASVRDPTSGDYYDTNNRVTQSFYVGSSPPSTSYSNAIYKWGGVTVLDTGPIPYPDSPPSSVTVGAYTYFMGALKTSGGSEPAIQVFGIYRTGPA